MFLNNQISLFKLLNVILRISGVGSKFIVLAVLSKTFSETDFGNYSLIISVITLSIFILGFDFYNFSIRNILRTTDELEIGNKLFSSVVFYCLIYLLFAAFSQYFFNQISFTAPHIFYVILLCITEHLSQEIYRMLIGFGKVLMANILLFLRTAGWSLIILSMILSGQIIKIDTVLKFWLIANGITLIYVLIYLSAKKFYMIPLLSVKIKWILKGIKICYIFFIATVFLKIIEYANRFIVDYYLGAELAGIFTFYSSIAILITLYINTIVISFELPDLIKSTDKPIIKELVAKFKKSLMIQILVIIAILAVIIKPFLIWQDKPEFSEYLPILILLVIGVAFMNYSLVYHFKLYIKHFDKSIVAILIYVGIFSVISALIMTKYFGLYGTSVAFMLSGIYLHFLRYSKAKKIAL